MMQVKQRLYDSCVEYVARRILTARSAITAAREASASDGKSSAGDKYETTREMMQQEIARNEVQLAAAGKLKAELERMEPGKKTAIVRAGSLVLTDNGNFYVAVGAGQIVIENVTYYAISVLSPIGSSLIGKKEQDELIFNGKLFKIQQVI